MAAQSIDGLGSLPDQKFAHAKHHCRALGFIALYGLNAHRRTQRGLANRLGISRITFLTFEKGLHIGTWMNRTS